MSLTVLPRSSAFRAISMFMASTLTYSASATGCHALALGAVNGKYGVGIAVRNGVREVGHVLFKPH